MTDQQINHAKFLADVGIAITISSIKISIESGNKTAALEFVEQLTKDVAFIVEYMNTFENHSVSKVQV